MMILTIKIWVLLKIKVLKIAWFVFKMMEALFNNYFLENLKFLYSIKMIMNLSNKKKNYLIQYH